MRDDFQWSKLHSARGAWQQARQELVELPHDVRSKVLVEAIAGPNHRRIALMVVTDMPSLASRDVTRSILNEVISGGPDLDLIGGLLPRLPRPVLTDELRPMVEEIREEATWLAVERVLWILRSIGELSTVRSLVEDCPDVVDPDVREICESYQSWLAGAC